MGVESKINKENAIFLCIIIFSFAVFHTASWYEQYLYRIINTDAFLGMHIYLELLSICMSFAIFAITFYTFEKSNRLRSIIIACTFLAVSLIDTFHTLAYKGMPVFLTESSAAKATTFWVIARLTMSFGFLAGSIISKDRKVEGHRLIFSFSAISYSIVMLILVSYRLEFLPALFIVGQGLTPLKVILEYVVIFIQIIIIGIYMFARIRGNNDEGYIFIVAGLIVSIMSSIAFTLYSSVYDTYNLLGHIYKIVAYYLLFRGLFVINVQIPYENMYMTEKTAINYANNLKKIVDKTTLEITEANERIMKDLDYAENIQRALLPTAFPKIPSMDFAARYLPCEKVGGDFYNVFKLDDDNLGILIGDVAGHGVSAAMITVFINQNIHVRRDYDDGRYRILSPKQVLTNLYHVYNKKLFPEEVYLVMFYAILNIKTYELTYSSAGMNTTPIILDKKGDVQKINIEGFPICMFGDHFNPNYENMNLKMKPGDNLILYTDGLNELDRKNPELFSEKQLIEFIYGLKDVNSDEIASQVIDAYNSFLGDKQMLDDVTVFVISIRKDM